jgi:hypothetical protein
MSSFRVVEGSRRLALFTLVLAACSSGPIPRGDRPGWVSQPTSDARFPPSAFVVGVGYSPLAGKPVSEVLAAVDAAARAQLAATLQGTLPAQVLQDFDLSPATEIASRWRDGDTAYALAALSKAKGAALQQSRVAGSEKAGRDLIAQGDAAEVPGDALRSYSRARAEAESTLRGVLLLRALGGSWKPVATATAARARIADLLEALSVSVSEGDRQRGADGKPLPQPVVFTARLKGKPAAGLPLAAQINGGRAVAAVTGADGKASIRVEDIGTFVRPEQRIAVALDWAKLLGVEPGKTPAWTLASAKPLASAFAIKRAVSNTRVLVLISEKIEGGAPVSAPPVTAAVTQTLQRAGFDVQDAKAFVERVRAAGVEKLNVATLKEHAKGSADVVVVGTVSSRAASGGALARADVRAIDLATGEVVFQSASGELPGKRQGELNVAGRAALEAVGDALSPSLEKTLRGVVSAP